MFVRSAEHSWEVPALLDSRGLDHALSYGTTSLAAAHLAGHLREAGVGPGVPVGLLMDRSQAQVLMVLATWAVSAGPSQVSQMLPLQRQLDGSHLLSMLRGPQGQQPAHHLGAHR